MISTCPLVRSSFLARFPLPLVAAIAAAIACASEKMVGEKSGTFF
jgi:hypothetical protein